MDPPQELDISASLSETVETRREQAGAKGALARGLLALQNRSSQLPSSSEPSHMSETTMAPESRGAEAALGATDTSAKPQNNPQAGHTFTVVVPDLSFYELDDDLNPPMDIAQALSGFIQNETSDHQLPVNDLAVASSLSIQIEDAEPGPSTRPADPESLEWPDEMLDSVNDNDTSE